jgi:hypothetical protein
LVDKEEPPSADEIEEIYEKHFHPGLSKLFIYLAQPGYASKMDAISSELSEHIVLSSVEQLFSKMSK